MSSSNIYRISKTVARHIEEFPNGVGTGLLLWRYLGEKYLNKDVYDLSEKELIDMTKSPEISSSLKIVHKWTCDGAVCPNEKVQELADCIRVVYDITQQEYPNHVNHWLAVAETLESAKQDKRSLGFVLSVTSICDYYENWSRNKLKLWNIFNNQNLT